MILYTYTDTRSDSNQMMNIESDELMSRHS